MNAIAGRETTILAVIPVVPSATDDTIVIHREAWGSALGVGGQFQQHSAALRLGDASLSARRILLMNGRTNWTTSVALGTGSNLWGAHLTALEMIELSVNGGPVAPSNALVPERIAHTVSASITVGEALFRHVEAGSYLDTFSWGVAAADGYLPDNQRLNPTQFNFMAGPGSPGDDPPVESQLPEPASAMLLACVLAAQLARRRSIRA